ncbi:O-methyltransferase [Mycobacterium phage Taquito]|uniref:O-methyltransferase n=2 Tax=Fionnbharthvirus TaxID=2948708 RepID=A0A1J0MDP4_9CAUD|nr:DNA methyltransferase [Mycobacterium phage Cheetobro]YP_009950531.1 DNA methyltransferase [Mycobacterium phage Taquito]ALA46364.1 methyltransferase [Mycobacterium phage Slarp]APD19220.1 O-methyltransferase [Mycobacterium phage Mitti]AII27263.1 methyltransferase [Mycobacterium phage Cheetobro]AOT23215.1 O-methyltransferase [Mycobacterium phage Taquito]
MIEVDGIKTFSNKQALDALAELAAAVPADQAIVEVGVYRGGSLRTIALRASAHVYGVDTWGLEGAYASGSESAANYGIDNMMIAQRAVAELPHVTLVRAFSADAAHDYDGPTIGLLYVDGEHTYDAVLTDFHAWRPYLAPEAVVAFDDYRASHRAVVDAVRRLVRDGHLTAPSVAGGRLAVCQRAQRDLGE